MVRRDIAALILGASALLATSATATISRTDPQEIRQVAERFVAGLGTPGSTVHAVAGHLDPRLNLAPCVGVLTPYLPTGAAVRPRTVVGVRCPAAGGWSIFVPVAVESEAAVLVAKRTLSRGETPAAGDVEAVTRRVPGLGAQFPSRLADVSGRRLRRAVAAGQPLAADALAAPTLVERGAQVTAVAEVAGIAVRAGAVALEAGGQGDRVRVRNAVSGRVVEGTVQADGTVNIGP
jgi:flagella basal body P-ring formation protein FlgA